MRRRYGASPWHLVALLVGGAVSVYAVTRVTDLGTLLGIGLWFAFLLVAHDLMLFPVYSAADRVVVALDRSAVPWVNFVRVPALLSGLLLLAWFPLVLRLPRRYEAFADRSVDPFLWRWLAAAGVLAAGSALLYAVRRLRHAGAARPEGQSGAGGGPPDTVHPGTRAPD